MQWIIKNAKVIFNKQIIIDFSIENIKVMSYMICLSKQHIFLVNLDNMTKKIMTILLINLILNLKRGDIMTFIS